MNYVTVTGKDVRCQAFLEYRHLDRHQLNQARAYIANRDWSGTGQQAYDTAKATAPSLTPDTVDEAFSDILDIRFEQLAKQAVPGAVRDIDTEGPQISGWSMACPTGQRRPRHQAEQTPSPRRYPQNQSTWNRQCAARLPRCWPTSVDEPRTRPTRPTSSVTSLS